MPLLAYLSVEDRDALADLAADFLRREAAEGADGLEIVRLTQGLKALQACLPVRRFGLDLHSGRHKKKADRRSPVAGEYRPKGTNRPKGTDLFEH